MVKKVQIANSCREINKAFCGFLYQFKYQKYQKILQENGWSSEQVGFHHVCQ